MKEPNELLFLTHPEKRGILIAKKKTELRDEERKHPSFLQLLLQRFDNAKVTLKRGAVDDTVITAKSSRLFTRLSEGGNLQIDRNAVITCTRACVNI